MDGVLRIGGLPDHYLPGRTYALTLELDSFEMERAGFQLAARFTDGPLAGTSAGVLRPVDGRTGTGDHPDGRATYLQHSSVGTDVADPDRARWSFEWTAPVSERTVVFHAAANSANGDDSPFGDLVYTLAAKVSAEPARRRPPTRRPS